MIGGLIGGPLAKALITRRRLAVHDPAAAPEKQPPLGESASHGGFENPEQTRLISTAGSAHVVFEVQPDVPTAVAALYRGGA